jgi:hypothetical protein
MANSFDEKIKAWLTPGLITVFGVFSWSLIEEIRGDVKLLLKNDAQTQIKLENLERRMTDAERVIYAEKLFATKPEEVTVPKQKKK